MPPRGRTPTRDEAYVKALEEERDEAVRRATEAEHKAIEEACRAKQLSQERTQLMLQLTETETSLERRMASAEMALIARLREMEGIIAKVEAERDQLALDLADCHQILKGAHVSDERAERKQIVAELRAIKSDAENSLEQRMEAAERELVNRLQSIEARVANAQDWAQASTASKPCGDFSGQEEFIEALKREKAELSAKLQSAWMKIDEMERMLQDERETFWEEMDLMRLDKGTRAPSATRVVAPSSQQASRVLSSPTPTVVRMAARGIAESTPRATPSPRQPGSTIKATPGLIQSGQRGGLYP
jgi:hypothetical protein